MASGRKVKTKQRKQDAGGTRNRQGLVASRFFAPAVGVWGAALGGLAVMVMPESVLLSVTEGTLIATYDVPLQPLVAGVMAFALGGLLFAIAASRSARARRQSNPASIVNGISRKVSPIDPARDLGSTSIDDPVETMPFVSPAWRDADVPDHHDEEPDDGMVVPHFMRHAMPEPEDEAEFDSWHEPDAAALREVPAEAPDAQPLPHAISDPLADPEPAPALPESVPIALDLAEFAELPGRNAVWVEEPAAPAVSEPAPAPTPVLVAADPVAAPAEAAAPEPAPAKPRRGTAPLQPPLPGTAALARLRAVPASELSMAEMVERFAGALHEHRASAPVRSLNAAELAAREAALMEALKALAALSGIGAPPEAEDAEQPLRTALRQLQPHRGAA